MNVKELRHQHAEIMNAARELAAAVSDDMSQRPVAALRWRLARLLIAHLAVEDGYFYPSMLKNERSATRETASRFQAEMGSLSAAFTAYMSAWTDSRIAQDWPTFCEETRSLLQALGQRVDREERHLYPLAPENWSAKLLA